MAFADELAEFLKKPEHGDPFNPKAWPSDLKYRRELLAHKGPILRKHVFAKADRTMRGVIWSLVWGYPRGKQAGNATSLKEAMEELYNVEQTVRELREYKTDAGRMIDDLNWSRKGLSTASTSKIAYFARIDTDEGPALIFDQQAATAIFERNDPEFAPLLNSGPFAKYAAKDRQTRVKTALARPDHYREYIRHIHLLAKELAVAADDIERFLFVCGQGIRDKEGRAKASATRAAKKAAKV